MHPLDCTASAKAGFFPSPRGLQSLSPLLALVLAILLGWGLSAASLNPMLNHSQASLPTQAIQETIAKPAVAAVTVSGTANTAPSIKAWAGPGEAPRRTWPPRSERDVADLEGAGCTAECLKTLRQRLLDHHRQAAPVWVF